MQSMFFLLLSLLFLTNCSSDDTPDNSNSLPEITVESVSVIEQNEAHPIYLSLRLSEASTLPVTMLVKSADATANAGSDYEAVEEQTVTWEPGNTQVSFKMIILGDTLPETNESFLLQCSNPTNAILITNQASVLIENDDAQEVPLDIPTTGFQTPMAYEGMSLIWHNEFEINDDLEADWTFEIGTGSSGWGNNELQYYKKENAALVAGNLVIEAKEASFGGSNYTSTRMITKNAFDFTYGRVDIRAVMPYGQGIWPALWMLGSNISEVGWPACGEIDIMELVGNEPNTVHGTIHWANADEQHTYIGGETSLNSGSFNDAFHVFSIVWDENKIEWLLDDEPYYSIAITSAEKTEFHDKFFFIFNVAVGGNWPGSPNETTVFPQYMIVDYIRVFQ
jgi:hypothetical protein